MINNKANQELNIKAPWEDGHINVYHVVKPNLRISSCYYLVTTNLKQQLSEVNNQSPENHIQWHSHSTGGATQSFMFSEYVTGCTKNETEVAHPQIPRCCVHRISVKNTVKYYIAINKYTNLILTINLS